MKVLIFLAIVLPLILSVSHKETLESYEDHQKVIQQESHHQHEQQQPHYHNDEHLSNYEEHQKVQNGYHEEEHQDQHQHQHQDDEPHQEPQHIEDPYMQDEEDSDYFPKEIDALTLHLEFISSITQFITQYETPIRAHIASFINRAAWNCLASHHRSAKDILTKKRPRYVSHRKHFNSEARVLCTIHAIQKMLRGGFLPNALETWESLIRVHLGNITMVPSDSEILKKVQAENASPIEIGHYVGYKVLRYMRSDGSNFDGATGSNGEKCLANCIVYGDNGPKPYAPVNDPFMPTKFYGRYKPVVETNGLGFQKAQGHITPHFGKIKLEFLSEEFFTPEEISACVAAPPTFDLEKESHKTLTRVKRTGTNERRKLLSEVFDDKIRLAGILFTQLKNKYQFTYEEAIFLAVGITLTEYESIILSWREKMKHDRVRPATFIKDWGLRKVNSWLGPYRSTGEMHAKEWYSYFRTMPHSEYPSASTCLCTMVADLIDSFLKDRYNHNTTSIVFDFPAGSSKVEPGVTPKHNVTYTLDSMTEFRDICGISRLWSGVHYAPSVIAGKNLCIGIGSKGGLAFLKKLIPEGYGSLSSTKKR